MSLSPSVSSEQLLKEFSELATAVLGELVEVEYRSDELGAGFGRVDKDGSPLNWGGKAVITLGSDLRISDLAEQRAAVIDILEVHAKHENGELKGLERDVAEADKIRLKLPDDYAELRQVDPLVAANLALAEKVLKNISGLDLGVELISEEDASACSVDFPSFDGLRVVQVTAESLRGGRAGGTIARISELARGKLGSVYDTERVDLWSDVMILDRFSPVLQTLDGGIDGVKSLEDVKALVDLEYRFEHKPGVELCNEGAGSSYDKERDVVLIDPMELSNNDMRLLLLRLLPVARA